MTTSKTWQDARKNCQSIGGDLAVIKSAQENTFVAKLAKKQSTIIPYVWIGLLRSE